MKGLFDALGLPARYQSDFDTLVECLSGSSTGRAYLLGDDSEGHLKVSLSLLGTFQDFEFDEQEVARLLYCFNFLKFHYFECGLFKTDPGLSFAVRQEKNLLGDFINKPEIYHFQQLIKRLLSVNASTIEGLGADARLGYVIWLLIIENGVLSTDHLVKILQTLAGRAPIHQLEGLYFIDYEVHFPADGPTYSKRTFLGPLTLATLSRSSVLSDLVSSRVDEITPYIVRKHRSQFVCRILDISLSDAHVTSLIHWFGVWYLPGFLYDISASGQPSFSLSLKNFARLHSIDTADQIPPTEQKMESDEDWGVDDEDVEELAEFDAADALDRRLTRRINTRFLSEKNIQSFLQFIDIHPTLSQNLRQEFRLIICLCFYLGLRRAEALYIRRCDVFPVESATIPHTIFVRPYPGRSLKTSTSERHVSLSLLPLRVRNFVVGKALEGSSELLIGRPMNARQEIHFFDQLNRLFSQFFGDGYAMHSCRHSYISNGILQSMFEQLGLDDLAACSSYIRECGDRSSIFLHAQRLPTITQKHMLTISQSAGHARAYTTLKSYLHSADLLTFGALCGDRPEGYQAAVARSVGVNKRTTQRWSAHGEFYLQACRVAADGLSVVVKHTEKFKPLSSDDSKAFLEYREHYKKPLSSRQLGEWLRLWRLFSGLSDDSISFLVGHLEVARAVLVMRDRADVREFKKMLHTERLDASLFEFRRFDAKARNFKPLAFTEMRVGTSHIRLRLNERDENPNGPRMIFPMLLNALSRSSSSGMSAVN